MFGLGQPSSLHMLRIGDIGNVFWVAGMDYLHLYYFAIQTFALRSHLQSKLTFYVEVPLYFEVFYVSYYVADGQNQYIHTSEWQVA